MPQVRDERKEWEKGHIKEKDGREWPDNRPLTLLYISAMCIT